MLFKMIYKERRRIQLLNLIFFVVFSLILLTVTYFVQLGADRVKRTEVQLNAQAVVSIEKEMITRSISGSVADVLYIADGLEQKFELAGNCPELERQWISFSNRMNIYDQIRYIDKTGMEIIRINKAADGAYSVADEDLQNKSGRYYFEDAMALEDGDVFIYKLDLNIENDEIEEPFKPTIRMATPVFLDGDKAPQGIVVLNYLADDILWQLQQITPEGMDVFLLNTEGYFIFNSEDRNKEWAFMYDDRIEEKFTTMFAEEWEAIRSENIGFLGTVNGAFAFDQLSMNEYLYQSSDASVWQDSDVLYIIVHIDPESETGVLFAGSFLNRVGRVVLKYLSLYFLMTGLSFLLAVAVAINRSQNKQIKYFSEFDPLTGVYNRRAGYQKLRELHKDASKRNSVLSVCFIDINGLKEVNDQLGHDSGDELIQSVAAVMQDSVRQQDFIARFGGDEFLIVFDRLDARGAESVWQRIVEKLDRINITENRQYILSASHGIDTVQQDDALVVDDIISRADSAMYEEKRKLKKTLQVIRTED